MKRSLAVQVALARINARSRDDWGTTRPMLSASVHAFVTTTYPKLDDSDFTGVDEYMTRTTNRAQLVEPGSAQVLCARVSATMRIAIGPGGSMVTTARSCLYLLDDRGKIQEERDQFFLMSD